MPHIEIIGYQESAERIRGELWNMLQNDPAIKDNLVITIVHSSTQNKHGRASPCLRVSATKKEDLDTVVAELERSARAFDIELVLLHGFVQTKKTTYTSRAYGVPS